MRFVNKLKKHFKEVLKLKTSPHSIALGFAIGTFIEVFIPIPLVDYLIAFIIVAIFKNVSKLSLFGALILINALITWPLILLSIKLGNFIFGDDQIIRFNIVLWDNIYNFTRRYVVGSLIVSTITAIVSYFVIYFGIKFYQKKRL